MPACFFRTNSFLDSEILQDTCLQIFIIASRDSEILVSEISRQIRGFQSHPGVMAKADFTKKMEDRIHELFREVNKEKLYHIVDALDEILFRLNEMNITSLKELKEVKTDKNIIAVLEKLK
jgi:rRNA pseudouridine-1189 N-methylase Emg1 (Nep1/Mra1 family)